MIIFEETIRDMEDLFVTYDQALDLKELGFNETCIAFYSEKVLTFHTHGIDPHFIFKRNTELWGSPSAPLKSQVFKWFRDNYKIQSLVQEYLLNNYMYTIDDGISSDISIVGFDTYEEAESACIDKLIEIVKTKKD
jgi:hypothetical protein